MDYEAIGSFIQEKRKEKKLTQKELADKLGITNKAISKWERGLGCPDVSILEDLSKELDCSILEILKGEKLDNINKDEINDYIKDSINYGVIDSKKYINKVITSIVIFIFVLVMFLNIINIYKLNIGYVYDFDDRPMLYINIKKDRVLNNIEIIKNSQGKYSDEDYKKIKEVLEDIKKMVLNDHIFSYKGKVKINNNDLYLMDITSFRLINISYAFYDLFSKYDINIDLYKKYFLYTIESSRRNDIYIKEHMEDYNYNNFNLYPNNKNSISYNINERILARQDMIAALEYLTDLIMEAGDIYE